MACRRACGSGGSVSSRFRMRLASTNAPVMNTVNSQRSRWGRLRRQLVLLRHSAVRLFGCSARRGHLAAVKEGLKQTHLQR